MDWAIAVSVLVGLLLFPVTVAVIGAVVCLLGLTTMRGRLGAWCGRCAECCRQ
jgi:hypothetical protein